MEPFRFHVFVCDQQKAEGVPCCSCHGSAHVIDALRKEIATHSLEDEVQVTVCGSLGLCTHGPNMVVYPDGIWYSGVGPSDVPEIVDSHFRKDTPVERLIRADMASVRAEVLNQREQMRSARRIREAAGSIPDSLNAQIRGFQESRAILTALELDLFTTVGDFTTAAEVALRLDTDPRATEMLLNALAALDLLIKQGNQYRNTAVAGRYLSSLSPDSARLALLHTASLWKNWSALTESVRRGTSVMDTGTTGRDENGTRTFIAAMHRNAAERAGGVVRTVGAVAGRMLDIGGGSGAYTIAFLRANPNLRIEFLDLPSVLPIARGHILQAGLEERVLLKAGDLRTADFGTGFDLVFASAICHMLSEAENADFLRRCRAALAPHGRLVIQDFILEPDKTSPKSGALFALNMLTGTPGGNAYSEPEYRGWLRGAGFENVRHQCLPGPASLMIAIP